MGEDQGAAIGCLVAGVVTGGVTYLFRGWGQTAQQRLHTFQSAPEVEIDDLEALMQQTEQLNLPNKPYVKLVGKVTSDEKVFCKYAKDEKGAPISAVVTQLTSRPKHYNVDVSTTGYLSFHDYWGPLKEEEIRLPQLYIAPHHMDVGHILNSFVGGSPTYKAVSIDLGVGTFHDPLVFPFLTNKSVLQVAHLYEPRSDETALRNQCQMETMAMFTASLLQKRLEGKDASVHNSILLGHDIKEYAIKQAAPIWAAGHIRRSPMGGFCLFEDDREETPFVLSTQPLAYVEKMLADRASWNNTMTTVFGGITGCFILGAAYSAANARGGEKE